jgi:hypothetical protein
MDFRISRELLGFLLHRNLQHEPGMSGQEHDPDMPDQLRRHDHSRTGMLHPDQWSHDLSRWIQDDQDPEEDHDWTGKLVELFGRANTEGIHMAIQGLRTKYNGEFDASELFKELDQIRPAETHWTFNSPAAMIGIALALFLIGILIWKIWFSKTDSMEAMLPALSAPPLPALNQPQRPIATPVTNNQATKSNASMPIHINISWRNSPKKGDIGTILEATSTMNFNKTPSAKTILL